MTDKDVCYICEKGFEAKSRPIQGDTRTYWICPSCEPRVKTLQFVAVMDALAALGR